MAKCCASLGFEIKVCFLEFARFSCLVMLAALDVVPENVLRAKESERFDHFTPEHRSPEGSQSSARFAISKQTGHELRRMALPEKDKMLTLAGSTSPVPEVFRSV